MVFNFINAFVPLHKAISHLLYIHLLFIQSPIKVVHTEHSPP
jgi:hypothetical protein